MSTLRRCPECRLDVGPTWRWCHRCGYDPNGARTRDGVVAYAISGGPVSAPPIQIANINKIVATMATVLAVTVLVLATLKILTPIAASILPKASPTWTTYSPPDKTFNIELIGTPTFHTSTLDLAGSSLAFNDYETIVNADTVKVGSADFPPALLANDPTGRLDQASLAITARLGGVIVARTHLEVEGLAAIDFVVDIRDDNGERFVFARALLNQTGSRLYLLQVVGAAPNKATFDRLASSLEIPT